MKRIRTLLPIALILITLFSSSMTAHAYSTVRYGSRGADVKTLQTMLNTVEGTKLAVDGIFGQATKNAVVNFQRKNKLAADGIAGAKTWAALEKQYNAKKNAKVASTLKIGPGRYSPGTVTQGNAYSFSGKITSNYKIEVVIVKILNSSGQVIQIKSTQPNTSSYDIKNLDNYIRFGTLTPNTYYFVVEARDASKKSGKLVNNKFTVSAPVTQVNNSNIRTAYAKQIYQLYQGKKISFTYGNEHKKNKDNAYALNNIQDTANGKAASRSNYGTAPGGTVYLDPQLLKIILDLQARYGTLTISEIAGANHSKGSLHYAGKAVDMTVIGGKRTAALGKEVYQFLTARGYKLVPAKAGTVLEGSSHFHIAIR